MAAPIRPARNRRCMLRRKPATEKQSPLYFQLMKSVPKLAQYFHSRLGRNTLWMTISGGLVLAMQAIYFVIIARSLGPDQYGAFSASVSLVAMLGPFASWGMGNLLIRNVARDRSLFNEC